MFVLLILSLLKGIIRHEANYMKTVQRFRKFKTENWIVTTLMALATVVLLYITIGCIVSVVGGHTIFGDTVKQSDSFFKKNGDVLMIILLSAVTLALLGITVYTLFFKKIDDDPVEIKVIDGRQIVNSKEKKVPETHFKEKNTSETLVISSEKLIKAKEDMKIIKNKKDHEPK